MYRIKTSPVPCPLCLYNSCDLVTGIRLGSCPLAAGREEERPAVSLCLCATDITSYHTGQYIRSLPAHPLLANFSGREEEGSGNLLNTVFYVAQAGRLVNPALV